MLCLLGWRTIKWGKQQTLQMEILKLHKRQTEGGLLIILNARIFSPNFLIKIYLLKKSSLFFMYPNEGKSSHFLSRWWKWYQLFCQYQVKFLPSISVELMSSDSNVIIKSGLFGSNKLKACKFIGTIPSDASYGWSDRVSIEWTQRNTFSHLSGLD